MKPRLVCVVTSHIVYFSARVRSEMLNLGVSCVEFHLGVNGLKSLGRPKQSSVESLFASVLF